MKRIKMFGRQEDCDSTRNYVCFQNRDQELNGSTESIGGQTVPVPEVGLSGNAGPMREELSANSFLIGTVCTELFL